ncbi:MAG: phytanoyl-CoA dioxygenase family protein [Planctomycetes bacterium]|nr:phytanoyl-CoA dioxygenase family protein [Planctomycetota bacterium]
MGCYRLSSSDADAFRERGFFVVPGLFDQAEVDVLRGVALATLGLDPNRLIRHDAEGNETLLSLRNELRDDVFSATVRCERVAATVSLLLGDEVYHYHHKVMIKEPLVGGAWEWHQDYGYWYQNGCLSPDMASCMVAITRATPDNGCVEVVAGSHALGRMDHVEVDDQVCAEPERVQQVLRRMEVVPLDLSPGDGVFFHANLLHRSAKNSSSEPRLSLINCYNTRTNDPYKQHHHPGYTPMSFLSDEDVLSTGLRQLEQLKRESEL